MLSQRLKRKWIDQEMTNDAADYEQKIISLPYIKETSKTLKRIICNTHD